MYWAICWTSQESDWYWKHGSGPDDADRGTLALGSPLAIASSIGEKRVSRRKPHTTLGSPPERKPRSRVAHYLVPGAVLGQSPDDRVSIDLRPARAPMRLASGVSTAWVADGSITEGVSASMSAADDGHQPCPSEQESFNASMHICTDELAGCKRPASHPQSQGVENDRLGQPCALVLS